LPARDVYAIGPEELARADPRNVVVLRQRDRLCRLRQAQAEACALRDCGEKVPCPSIGPSADRAELPEERRLAGIDAASVGDVLAVDRVGDDVRVLAGWGLVAGDGPRPDLAVGRDDVGTERGTSAEDNEREILEEITRNEDSYPRDRIAAVRALRELDGGESDEVGDAIDRILAKNRQPD
jgi:hypothetical protein